MRKGRWVDMKRFTSRQIAFAGLVAALYAAITLACAPFAYGAVQFRLSEALTVLCCFSPSAVWGMVIGCVGANLISSVGPVDVLLGALATLLACLLTRKIRSPLLLPLPTVVCNAVIVGAEIAFFVDGGAFWSAFALNAGTVALGELAVMVLLGLPLYLYLQHSGTGDRLSALGTGSENGRR